MTTYADRSVTCYVCGKPSTHTVLASTNAFGSPDLDLRPPPMKRETMRAWVQCCPTCGYCQSDLARETPGARRRVTGEDYRAALGDGDYPDLARRFRCQSLLEEAAGDARGAARASLCAAWACDDAGRDAQALACRERAMGLLLASQAAGTRESTGGPEAGESAGERAASDAALLADVMRRAGRFQEAAAQCDRGLAALGDEPAGVLSHVLRFQRELAAARDPTRHTVAGALASQASGALEGAPAPRPAPAGRPSRAARENAAAESKTRAAAEHEKGMALWRRIVADGWACTHCRRTGLADKDFRLSVGAVTVILCRACGWPQDEGGRS